jgi:hypothetical protein
MNPEKWTRQIDEITASFREAFGALTVEQLNWKPNAQTWSIAQILDHLIVTNGTYYPVIRQIRANTYRMPWIGKWGFMTRFFGKFILDSVQPDRRRKMKTFPMWEPSASELGGDIVERFGKHQAGLKQLIEDSRDLVEKGVVISSPANRNIVYKLDAAFDIIVAHERRHFEQAREVFGAQLSQAL